MVKNKDPFKSKPKSKRKTPAATKRKRQTAMAKRRGQETLDDDGPSVGGVKRLDDAPKHYLDLIPAGLWANIKGNFYPTYKGLLLAAHDKGLMRIECEVVQTPMEINAWTAVVKAKVTFKDGSIFEEVGDANPKSVANKSIAVHAIRMAATRAKGRALRDALNIGEASVDEVN